MCIDSAATEEKKKNLQCTWFLVDLDYSTQEAKYINLVTVGKKRHTGTSEEACCIIFLKEMSTLDKRNLRGKEYL